MSYVDYFEKLKNIGVANFATVTKEGEPRNRMINIGVANEEGIFFMTSPKSDFYQQLQDNPQVAITGFTQDEGVQVVSIEGKVRELGKERLEEILKGNRFVKAVYPDQAERQLVRAFQVYEGRGYYRSLTAGIKDFFEFNTAKDEK